jgi:hypothetical protein
MEKRHSFELKSINNAHIYLFIISIFGRLSNVDIWGERKSGVFEVWSLELNEGSI